MKKPVEELKASFRNYLGKYKESIKERDKILDLLDGKEKDIEKWHDLVDDYYKTLKKLGDTDGCEWLE